MNECPKNTDEENFTCNPMENERRLQEAERLAKMGSWELDLVNDTLHWSDEIYRIFDTTPQSFGATYEAFLNFIHPDDRELVNEAYQNSLITKEPYGPITHRLIMKDGEIKFVEERGYTTYDKDGNPLKSTGVVQDITERIMGERAQAQLKEKEILLKEIYHRVKNNLQLISSLIAIQASQTDNKEVKSQFDTCCNRIATISLLHEQLYKSKNLARIKIEQHIHELLENIKKTYQDDRNITFDVNVVNISIGMNEAVPLGLIMNEIITNSFKHAFDEKGGKITIRFNRTPDHKWLLEVSDNGKGAESPEKLLNSASFGTEIISSLVDQLDGDMEIVTSPNNGVKYRITFE